MEKSKKKGAPAPVKARKVDPLILGTLIFAVVVLVALIVVCVYRNSDSYITSQSAMKVGDTEVKATEYAYYYNNSVNNFISTNYDYLSYMGLDLQKPLASQSCGLNKSITWAQYFEDSVDQIITQTEVLYAEGKKAGFEPEGITEKVDTAIEEMKHHAEEDGESFEDDMEKHYGRKYTEAEIRSIIEKGEYASRYREKVLAETEATQEDKDLYYEENKSSYWRATYRVETFAFSETGEENIDSKETAQQKANDMLAAITDEASFETLAKANYTEEELAAKSENFTLKTDVSCSSISSAIRTWIMDGERQQGDKTVIENSASFDVVYFIESRLDDYKTADIRLIYLPVETETDASDEDKQAAQEAVESKANALYGEWAAGDKTEDSFAELAKANSKDNKAESGSLYEDVNKTSFATDLTDWIFAYDRKPGDCQIINTASASYIVYFSAQGETYWENSVEEAVKQNNYDNWYEATKNTYTVTKNSDVIAKVLQ